MVHEKFRRKWAGTCFFTENQITSNVTALPNHIFIYQFRERSSSLAVPPKKTSSTPHRWRANWWKPEREKGTKLKSNNNKTSNTNTSGNSKAEVMGDAQKRLYRYMHRCYTLCLCVVVWTLSGPAHIVCIPIVLLYAVFCVANWLFATIMNLYRFFAMLLPMSNISR